MKANVLIVDDDADLRRALGDRLRYWDHAVAEAADGREALEALTHREFDLVLLDLSMPGMSGLEVLRALGGSGCRADVVVLTAHGSVEAAVEALKLGAADFLAKPADFELLRAVIGRALEKRRLESVNRMLAEQVSGAAPPLVCASPALRALLETAGRAAQASATVLLTGESGVGKQVIAEYIHRQSPRASGPFVYVNCVALTDTLIESTLFGHEKGAFTGALARKEGRLESAGGGTAFLDEVGDISSALQAKLLHFLETGEFERIGSTRTLCVDCRIIAATNRDLDAAMREQKFREDLYFRLNVIRLHVPALRERPEDVAPLAEAFLGRFAAELKRGRLKLAARTAEILSCYSWPGNVRQLKNAIERMAVLAPGDTLTPDLLPPEILAPGPGPAPAGDDLNYRDAVRRFKGEHISRALARTGGNQKKAAELLGLQRTFLNRLIKELGLDPAGKRAE